MRISDGGGPRRLDRAMLPFAAPRGQIARGLGHAAIAFRLALEQARLCVAEQPK